MAKTKEPKWSRTRPEAPGHYWFRGKLSGHLYEGLVAFDGEILIFLSPGMENLVNASIGEAKGRWMPVTLPPPAKPRKKPVPRMHSLLVIDFDYFVPMISEGPDFHLYDWAHAEDVSERTPSSIWADRAAGFIRFKKPLPRTSGEEEDFWKRFKFAPGATLFYADSNVAAVRIPNQHKVGELWLYDAHHDCGYKESPQASIDYVTKNNRITYEDWMISYGLLGTKLNVRYPRWREGAMTSEPEPALFGGTRSISDLDEPTCVFDKVFVCRSGAWVPPWLDSEFWAFLDRAPMKKRRMIGSCPIRRYDEAMAQKLAASGASMRTCGIDESQLGG